jgi:hypothetical protein
MIEDANQAHQRAKSDMYDNVLFICCEPPSSIAKGSSNTARRI